MESSYVRKVSERIAAALALAMLAVAGCGGESAPVSLNEWIHRLDDGQPATLISGACVIYDLNAGSENLHTSATFDTMRVRQWIANHSANIEIEDRCPECVVSKRYDEGFLRSDVHDEFMLTAVSGQVYQFEYWGSAVCTSDRR